MSTRASSLCSRGLGVRAFGVDRRIQSVVALEAVRGAADRPDEREIVPKRSGMPVTQAPEGPGATGIRTRYFASQRCTLLIAQAGNASGISQSPYILRLTLLNRVRILGLWYPQLTK